MFEEFDDNSVKTKFDTKLWKRLFRIALAHKKEFLLCIISVIVLELNETVFIKIISDYGFGKYLDEGISGNFWGFFAILLAMALLEGVLVKGFVYYAGRLEMIIYEKLTVDCFNHMQELSYSFFDKYSVGWLISRITSDTQKVSEIISWGLSDLISCSFKIIFILVFMLTTSVKLSLVMLIVVPIALVISILVRKKVIKAARAVRKANSQVSGALNEGISAAKTSKSLVLEAKNLERFKGIVKIFRRSSLKSSVITGIYYQTLSIIFGSGIAAMAYFGGREVFGNILSYATLFMFVSYSTMVFDPILGIAASTTEMKMAQVSADRVFKITDLEPDLVDSKEVVEKYGTIRNPKKENYEKIKGDVEFKHVTFKYETGPVILSDFNLKVKAGSSIALVGETGAGKSTIVNLMCRFYEPTSGEILIDGVDYRKRSIGWLHENLGYVMQTPYLFSGSVKENIKYGKLDASDDEIVKAAKAANAHDFIGLLEKGYDSDVGEGGNRLSQGQKQLVSFARAIVADPKILILDEATSSIDTQTEYVIQEAISKILKGRTSFIIAHRLSTITSSDLILVVQAGKVIEQGSHEELMKLKGYYYKLYTNQFVEDRLKEINIL